MLSDQQDEGREEISEYDGVVSARRKRADRRKGRDAPIKLLFSSFGEITRQRKEAPAGGSHRAGDVDVVYLERWNLFQEKGARYAMFNTVGRR